jgi:hypothetical protein
MLKKSKALIPKPRRQSAKLTLSRVKAEMEKPRVVLSARSKS